MRQADDRPTDAIHATPAEPATGASDARAGESLTDLARTHGIDLSPQQAAQFDAYRALLLEWNERINLTAVTNPADVDRRLFLDSILLLPALDSALNLMPGPPYRLVDIGSGAGFPGLPIKIMRPDLDMTLIEATGKKVAFLDACIARLGLERTVTVYGRAEDLAHTAGYREQFDLVTARAVASLPALLELGMPLLHTGGRGLFPKGLDIATELSAATAAAPLVGGKIVASRILPGGQTTLIAVAKVASTPAHYPRRAGIPAREPLGHLDRSLHDSAVRGRRRPRAAPRPDRPDPPRAERPATPAAAKGSP